MSDMLTTGQMIDQLKIGQEAEIVACSNIGLVGKKVYRSDTAGYGAIRFCADRKFLKVVGPYLSARWRLLPKYVSFAKAMKALEEGKTIQLHHSFFDIKPFDKHAIIQRLGGLSLSFKEWMEANWSIVD